MPSTYLLYEVRLSMPLRPDASDLLQGVVTQTGVPAQQWIEKEQNGRLGFSAYFTQRRRAERTARLIRHSSLKGVSLRVKKLRHEDWARPPRDARHPVRLTPSTRVVAPQTKPQSSRADGKAGFIRIDPGLAFGTGRHATTQLLAELIERRRGRYASFLDIGTGTGILAIVAGRGGAREIYALDQDPESIRAARRHFQDNGVSGVRLIRTDLARWRSQRQFDFVAANLNSHDLIRLRDKIMRRVRLNGYLGVSGIGDDNLARVRKTFKTRHVRCLRCIHKNGWTAVLYKKAVERG